MDDERLLRYSRQILLPQIDLSGQEALLNSSVLIVGLGGLGSPVAMYLAAAGVGHLRLNDFDRVDLSNLQRQIIHSTRQLGELKTRSAQAAIADLNPDVRVSLLEGALDQAAMDQAVAEVDLVLDCSDNLATRFRVNAACVRAQKPLVSGAVIRFEGQLAVFTPGQAESPCYNCLYGMETELEEGCSRSGVVAALPGVVGSLQAIEAIKWLTGAESTLSGSVLLIDAWSQDWRRVRLRRNPSCPTCGDPR